VFALAAGFPVAIYLSANQLQGFGHVGIDVAAGFVGEHFGDQVAHLGREFDAALLVGPP